MDVSQVTIDNLTLLIAVAAVSIHGDTDTRRDDSEDMLELLRVALSAPVGAVHTWALDGQASEMLSQAGAFAGEEDALSSLTPLSGALPDVIKELVIRSLSIWESRLLHRTACAVTSHADSDTDFLTMFTRALRGELSIHVPPAQHLSAILSRDMVRSVARGAKGEFVHVARQTVSETLGKAVASAVAVSDCCKTEGSFERLRHSASAGDTAWGTVKQAVQTQLLSASFAASRRTKVRSSEVAPRSSVSRLLARAKHSLDGLEADLSALDLELDATRHCIVASCGGSGEMPKKRHVQVAKSRSPPPSTKLMALGDAGRYRSRRRSVSTEPSPGTGVSPLVRPPSRPRGSRARSLGRHPVGRAPSRQRSCRSPRAPERDSPQPSGKTLSPLAGSKSVVLNCANIGFHYAAATEREEGHFSWEGVRRAIKFYDDAGLKPQGVCKNRTALMCPVPDDLAARVSVCPVVDDLPDVDDLFTIRMAQRFDCQYVDNDNYRDWKMDREKRGTDNELREWLVNGKGARLKVTYVFDGTGNFIPLTPPLNA